VSWVCSAWGREGLGILSTYINTSWGSREDRARLFSVVLSGRTRGNGHKSKYMSFHLHTRIDFFTVSMVKHCNMLPREAVESLNPWSFSKSDWSQSWATCFS